MHVHTPSPQPETPHTALQVKDLVKVFRKNPLKESPQDKVRCTPSVCV